MEFTEWELETLEHALEMLLKNWKQLDEQIGEKSMGVEHLVFPRLAVEQLIEKIRKTVSTD